jgi:hypothetical protein
MFMNYELTNCRLGCLFYIAQTMLLDYVADLFVYDFSELQTKLLKYDLVLSFRNSS